MMAVRKRGKRGKARKEDPEAVLRLCIYCQKVLDKKTAWCAYRNGGPQSACKKCSVVLHRFYNWEGFGVSKVCALIDTISERLKQMRFFVRNAGMVPSKMLEGYMKQCRDERRMDIGRIRRKGE